MHLLNRLGGEGQGALCLKNTGNMGGVDKERQYVYITSLLCEVMADRQMVMLS